MKTIYIFIVLIFVLNIAPSFATTQTDLVVYNDAIQKRLEKFEQDLKSKQDEVEKKINNRGTITTLAFIIITFGVIFGYIKYANDIINKRIEKELDTTLKDYLGQNVAEYKKHKKLKESQNIIIVSRDKIFNDNFEKVMELFKIDLTVEKRKLIIPNIYDYNFNELVAKLKEFDIVIIENIINKKWDMNDVATKKIFINIADSICDKTSIIYFGDQDNQFPSKEVSPERRDLLSFANVPSQLYGNLMNMLKYRAEMKIKV